MTKDTEVIDKIDILFAVEGREKPFSVEIEPRTSVSAFALLASRAAQIEGPLEVSLEDADQALLGDLVLIERLSQRFAPIHVSRPGLVHVTIHYQNRKANENFRPNVTIARVTAWAIGPNGLNLEGGPSDYQVKYHDQVVPPDMHLGQVAHGHKSVELELVFKLKPQGQN